MDLGRTTILPRRPGPTLVSVDFWFGWRDEFYAISFRRSDYIATAGPTANHQVMHYTISLPLKNNFSKSRLVGRPFIKIK
jgi:hypothetical protein